MEEYDSQQLRNIVAHSQSLRLALQKTIDKKELNELGDKFEEIKKELKILKSDVPEERLEELSKAIEATSEPIRELREKIEIVETLITQDPEKAVSLTLLKGRIKSLQIIVYGVIIPLIILILSYLLFVR